MSTSDVTKDGIRGQRPGRNALVGQGTGKHRRGDQPVVPDAGFTSYYGKPILNKPTWEARDIAAYFFLGGLAGAGSVMAAGAQLTHRPSTARALKISSLLSISGSAAALIHDLGRPARFHHMLRVVKPTSPMSVGSWLLAAYGPAAGIAAVLDVTGLFTTTGKAATAAAATMGPAVAAYTAVLTANTAVPAWHDAYRELPFIFTGSATTAAAGMALITAPTIENGPARGAAILGTLVESAATKSMEHRLGMIAEPYQQGTAGKLLRTAQALSLAGAVAAALLAGRSRTAAILSGGALLAASACTRFGIFHAGVHSATDPKYVVEPQRERLNKPKTDDPNRQ